MTTTFDQAMPAAATTPGILDRERIIATKGFNRWLVPPAALCIHLCIGMAYGFSVFWLPLSRALGITASKACPDMSLVEELFTTTCDWRRPRPRLHLAGLDAGEVISGPARHGDRHGDHGFRRRRDDRRAAREHADELFQERNRCRRLADLHRHGRDLLLFHDGGRIPIPAGGRTAGPRRAKTNR